MHLKNISATRLKSQQISGTKFKSAKELVSWMGALQAQDFAMVKWALGLRLQNSSEEKIQKALDKGEILRTHLMRPTWHLVAAGDIYWMLELTAPQIKIAARSREKELELTEAIFSKSDKIIETALTGGKHLTRDELKAKFTKAKIPTTDNRFSHLMMRAELEGIVCSGVMREKKQTYALLSERVPKRKTFTREEALGKLAQKYFSSHGPATLKDFSWWSGLSVKDSRQALEMVKSKFIPETMGTETYWLSHSFSQAEKENSSAYLLPAYDEFLVSYKDRTASLLAEHNKKALSENGIFRPVILLNGKASGLWKAHIQNDKAFIETDFFHPHNKKEKILIEKAADEFGKFIGKKTEIK